MYDFDMLKINVLSLETQTPVMECEAPVIKPGYSAMEAKSPMMKTDTPVRE